MTILGLMKRSRMDSHVDVSEIRCQPLPIQHIANFSYPRTDFVHLYQQGQPGARDSRGSESSPPPMVEDHGSDTSAEEDCSYRVTGADLWDSWHAREHEGTKPDYPALIKSPTGTQGHGLSSKPVMAQQDSPTRGPVRPESQRGQASRPAVDSCSEQESHAQKPPPKVSYSLFPPPSVLQKQALPPLQIPSVPRQSRLEPSPFSVNFPPTPSSRNAVADGEGSTMPTLRPGSSRATTPGSAHGGSIAASPSDSIPLLLRSPASTPPDSPPGTSSSSEAPRSCEAPRYPLRLRKRSPSQNNLQNSPLSKLTSRSTPSLANLANSHQQGQGQPAHHKPLTHADLYDRPLPPLPRERPPSPPNISVFEPDSDDEDGAPGSPPRSGEPKNFARRFMHGLVHHHHHLHNHHHQQQHNDRKEKGPLADHKRSVSDEGPSTSSSSKATRSGISRTFNVARHRRAGAVVEGSAARCAVSMELPRVGAGGQQDGQAVLGEEKSGRFWGRGSGEMLGRILRRKG